MLRDEQTTQRFGNHYAMSLYRWMHSLIVDLFSDVKELGLTVSSMRISSFHNLSMLSKPLDLLGIGKM